MYARRAVSELSVKQWNTYQKTSFVHVVVSLSRKAGAFRGKLIFQEKRWKAAGRDSFIRDSHSSYNVYQPQLTAVRCPIAWHVVESFRRSALASISQITCMKLLNRERIGRSLLRNIYLKKAKCKRQTDRCLLI